MQWMNVRRASAVVWVSCMLVVAVPAPVTPGSVGPSAAAAEPDASAPKIEKRGTVDLDLVETTPVVFEGTLYRFESVRDNYWNNDTGEPYFRFVNHETGAPTPAFAQGFHFGTAFVESGTVYVTGTNEPGGSHVRMFASEDLRHWDSWPVLNLPDHTLYNTSLCRAEDRYVLMLEIGKPRKIAGRRFTARFATSKDLRRWQLTPPDHVYAKDRYTAPHCLKYLDGYFYNFYLEAHQGSETRVVRSKDLVHWEPSPLNPVLRASEADRRIANPDLTEAQRHRIATATNRNNSDIAFCGYQGRVIINYSWGNQRGTEHLAEAVYHGTVEALLRGWFPGDRGDRQP